MGFLEIFHFNKCPRSILRKSSVKVMEEGSWIIIFIILKCSAILKHLKIWNYWCCAAAGPYNNSNFWCCTAAPMTTGLTEYNLCANLKIRNFKKPDIEDCYIYLYIITIITYKCLVCTHLYSLLQLITSINYLI